MSFFPNSSLSSPSNISDTSNHSIDSSGIFVRVNTPHSSSTNIFDDLNKENDKKENDTVNTVINNSSGANIQSIIKVLEVILLANKEKTITIPFSSITLSSQESDILNNIVKSLPESLQDIEKNIVLIAQDKSIGLDDIPYIMNIIKNVYLLISKTKISNIELKTSTENILKFIIHIILQMYSLNEPILVSSCDKLIDTCVDLLALDINIISQSKCCLFSLWK
jgi:hypothetical protein